MGNVLIGIVGAAVLAVMVWIIRLSLGIGREMRAPEKNPKAFLAHGRKPATKTLVVNAGDSITHGVVSANYVDMLDQRLAGTGYEFVNAGINGNLAWNVLQRLDDIIATQPDIVTLLIGTNDINATYDATWESRYRKEQNIPQTPTLAWYRQNVERILDRLQAETHARIAVLEIPPVGENLDSEMNRRVADYNAALREIAAQKQVALLPLNEKLTALLPPSHNPAPYEGRIAFGLREGVDRFILKRNWSHISAYHGFVVLTDHLHLNERAAGITADLIGDFLTANRH